MVPRSFTRLAGISWDIVQDRAHPDRRIGRRSADNLDNFDAAWVI